MRQCDIEGCQREAQRSGLCWTHVSRRTQGLSLCAPVRHYGLHPLQLLRLALDKYANAEEDLDYRRAQWLVWKRASLYRKARALKIHTDPSTL